MQVSRPQAKLEAEQQRRAELEAQTAERAAGLVEAQIEVRRDHDAVAARDRAEAEAARNEAAARVAAMKALQAEQLAQARVLNGRHPLSLSWPWPRQPSILWLDERCTCSVGQLPPDCRRDSEDLRVCH